MPVKTEIITDLELVLSKASGMVDDLSAIEHQALLASLPGFKPTYNFMIDARKVTENLLSPEGVIQMSGVTPFEASIRRAYVVGDEMTGMLATLSGSMVSTGKQFFVTYELEDACEWLGIPYNRIITSSVYNNGE